MTNKEAKEELQEMFEIYLDDNDKTDAIKIALSLFDEVEMLRKEFAIARGRIASLSCEIPDKVLQIAKQQKWLDEQGELIQAKDKQIAADLQAKLSERMGEKEIKEIIKKSDLWDWLTGEEEGYDEAQKYLSDLAKALSNKLPKMSRGELIEIIDEEMDEYMGGDNKVFCERLADAILKGRIYG